MPVEMDNFASFKTELARKNALWEDGDFPADSSSLAASDRGSRSIKWMRPGEITKSRNTKPSFIVQGATRFDLNQGELGDCWFIAAVSCLAVSQEQLLNRTIPTDQDFEQNYAGVFRFNFWRFGRWTEVLIDDRLPTRNGELIYARNASQPNEFWVPLIEKAYAKVNGSYDNITGGNTCDALVDFTGGISEQIDLRPIRSSPGQLFDVMYAMLAKSSMLACDIESKVLSSRPDRNGLYKGHAYSITNLFRLTSKGQKVRLLRIRNPWGKDEWNGRWSDSSSEWASIPDKAKKEIGVEIKNDGEFWMCFEDFVANFDWLWLCHLEPDAVADEIAAHKNQSTWEMTKHEASWMRGFNAGGCGNAPNQDLFWTNPQFSVHLKPMNASDNGTSQKPPQDVHLVLSLMQESVRLSKNIGIALILYRVRDGAPELLDGQNYDRYSLEQVTRPQSFITLREVTTHLQVSPGNYVVIPCTFYPNQDGPFLLRIYTETNITSQELDVPTTITPVRVVPDNLSDIFNRFTGNDKEMDAKELSGALDEAFKSESTHFSAEMSRCLLAMVDSIASGVLTLEQFRTVYQEVIVWTEKFKAFDKDRSGDIDTYEMTDLFNSIGLRLSRKVLESLVRKYGGKKRRLSLGDFILSASKVTQLYGQFTLLTKENKSDKVQFSLEEWLATTV